jgi:toxin ParE1/3/4
MSFAVEFTPGARQDLLKIHHYIKKVGRPEAANQLISNISEVCESFSESPERGHVPVELEGLADFACRQLVVKNYRIIYQIIGKVVVVYGVIDGRRSIREVMHQRLMV